MAHQVPPRSRVVKAMKVVTVSIAADDLATAVPRPTYREKPSSAPPFRVGKANRMCLVSVGQLTLCPV